MKFIPAHIARKAYIGLRGRTVAYDGIPLTFPPGIADGLLWSIARHGVSGFEPETWRTLRSLLPGAGTFLDIGANLGFYSVLAKKVNPSINVIAFEPLPELIEGHTKFCEANKLQIDLYRLALSDHNGTATFYVPLNETKPSTSTLRATSWQARKRHRQLTVPIMTLDRLLHGRTLREPLLIKIDVEDHEAAVLRGAVATIGRYRPHILCEILPRPKGDLSAPDDRPGCERHENRETSAVLAELRYCAIDVKTQSTIDDLAAQRTSTDFLLVPREHVSTAIKVV